jgi:hypothetical protein
MELVQDAGDVVVAFVIVTEDVVAAVHVSPPRRSVPVVPRAPRVESLSVLLYLQEPLAQGLVDLVKAFEHLLALDGFVHGFLQVLLGHVVRRREHENLRDV